MTLTIGILGGGQLARMMVMAGRSLGFDFLILDPADDACAGQVAPLVRAAYTDLDALARFEEKVDVATFDFENVPAESARHLAARVPVFPNPEALAIAQDRLHEKQLFRKLGMATPAFAQVDTREDLVAACRSVGLPAILKTRRFGYDGKGQFRIRREADIDPAWTSLAGQSLILEGFVDFDREVSIVAVRGRDGAFDSYPLAHNVHEDAVLSVTLAPAPDALELTEEARRFATSLATAVDYVGVFAIEFFVRRGALIANEIAPRVHNTGHWTIEGAETSQFENHLRAVSGLPLGSTRARGTSVMLNWIGHVPPAVSSETSAHWHDYGKAPRAGRKVGHTTVTGEHERVRATLERLAVALDRRGQIDPILRAL